LTLESRLKKIAGTAFILGLYLILQSMLRFSLGMRISFIGSQPQPIPK